MTGRLPEVEQAFLALIQSGASVDERFTGRVRRRLDRVGEQTGRDLPHHLTVREVVEEIREECEDIPGWSLMALHLARQRNLPGHVQRQLRLRLHIAGVLAAMIDSVLDDALRELPRERFRI